MQKLFINTLIDWIQNKLVAQKQCKQSALTGSVQFTLLSSLQFTLLLYLTKWQESIIKNQEHIHRPKWQESLMRHLSMSYFTEDKYPHEFMRGIIWNMCHWALIDSCTSIKDHNLVLKNEVDKWIGHHRYQLTSLTTKVH